MEHCRGCIAIKMNGLLDTSTALACAQAAGASQLPVSSFSLLVVDHGGIRDNCRRRSGENLIFYAMIMCTCTYKNRKISRIIE